MMSDEELERLLDRWEKKAPTERELEGLFSALSTGGAVAPTQESPAEAWLEIDGSSNVAAVACWPDASDPNLCTLGMRFLNGGEYHYQGVPRGVHRIVSLGRTARSGGRLSWGEPFWELVRRRGYPYVCVTRPRKNWRRTRP